MGHGQVRSLWTQGTTECLPLRTLFSPSAQYADLSEFGYGVAILSESKYGYSCRGNVLRLSLLRAATAPDAEQDQGKHEFSWAVMPHQGSFLESDVPVAAYLFNSALQGVYICVHDHLSESHVYRTVRYIPNDVGVYPLAEAQPPFVVEGGRNVFLETIKRGEFDDYSASSSAVTVILRLYEAYGGHAHVTLKVAEHIPVARAYVTNLLEDETQELQLLQSESEDGGPKGPTSLKLDFHSFEVKTVKLVIGPKSSSDAR